MRPVEKATLLATVLLYLAGVTVVIFLLIPDPFATKSSMELFFILISTCPFLLFFSARVLAQVFDRRPFC